MNSGTALLLVVSGAIALAADVDPATLLSSVRSKIRENAGMMPRYACRQRIERKDYARFTAPWIVSVHRQSGCGTLPERGLPKVSVLRLALMDRTQLDVMLAGGNELLSWPGGRSFDTRDPNERLGGGLSGSGAFANFLITVFETDKVTFEYVGACPGADCARYRYDVPLETSSYIVKPPQNVLRQLGFHGTFDVESQSANLVRMSVTATDPAQALPAACDIRTRMAYIRTQLEKAYIPQRQLLVGMRFDAIVLNGVPVPLTLDPMGETDAHWNAVFRFPVAKKVVLDRQFVSRWQVGLPAVGK